MSACPVFELTQGSDQCQLQNPLPAGIASEDVKGPRLNLPDNIQIQYGSQPATPPAFVEGNEPTTASGQGEYFAISSTAQNRVPTAPLPYGIISAANHAHVSKYPVADAENLADRPVITSAPVLPTVGRLVKEITLTTQYTTQGQEAYELVVVQDEFVVSSVDEGVTERHRRHLHHHQHGHGGGARML